MVESMGEVFFYKLTRQPVEIALPQLLQRALQQDWRVAVRCADRERMVQLDKALWLGAEEGFLPHGMANGPHAERQPILLGLGSGEVNAPDCVMCIDGAAIDSGEVNALERVCILFDGNASSALSRARSQWRELTEAGCRAQYWSQESGRWEMKREHPGST